MNSEAEGVRTETINNWFKSFFFPVQSGRKENTFAKSNLFK